LVQSALQRTGSTALWVYAPGFQDETSASLENMQTLTGIRFGIAPHEAGLDVAIDDFSHPITRLLPAGYRYGTGVDPQQYLQPPKIQYLPQAAVSPQFFADDPAVLILGSTLATGKPGLVVKESGDFHSIYSAAPLLSWQLLQGVARYAGVHLYVENGDMLWANRSFLTLYSQSAGPRTLHFPGQFDVEDAYTGQRLARAVSSIHLEMGLYETRLLFLHPHEVSSHV
jgi:hypothetical protein